MNITGRHGAAAAIIVLAAAATAACTLAEKPPRPAEPTTAATTAPVSIAPTATIQPRKPRTVNGRIQPARVRVPITATGHLRAVPGTATPPKGARGRAIRYIVEVERGLPFDPAEFARAVHTTLNDPRGWGHRFTRISTGPAAFHVALVSPATAHRRCLPLDVGLSLSCMRHGRAIINATRWGQGATSYGRDLATYREYVVNHEVGHALGQPHATCPGPGRPAPVMVQQTKSLYGCRPNPWPHRDSR